jgi:branched-chain amino acid transport system permease protein
VRSSPAIPRCSPATGTCPDATARTLDPTAGCTRATSARWVDGSHIRIIDRIKDIIITSGGKNISPSEIENTLKTSPFVKEAIVIGDRRKYLTALIGIEYEVVSEWAQRRKIPHTTYRDLSEKPEVVALIQKAVDKTNEKFARVEQIKKFKLLTKELDHEDGELTATQKVKRSIIEERFAEATSSRCIDESAASPRQRSVARRGIYAMVALGFVIIFKSTQVLNFAQPALLLLGAYWVVYFATVWNFPFWVAIGIAVALSALTGVIVERTALRPMVGKPVFAVAIMTIGINTVITVVALDLLGVDARRIGDPWGLATIQIGSITIAHRQVAAIITAVVLVSLLLAFFKYSRMGLAMRATAFDQEVALTQGVSVSSVFALSWAIAAILAMFGGVFIGSGFGLDRSAGVVALKALPVVVVGGLDSIAGAIVGALIIATAEVMTSFYQPQHAEFLGRNFSQVVPYLVMFIVLLFRPHGLFGTKEVERV